MHDALSRLTESSDRWLDGVLAATIVVICVAELAFAASRGTALTLEVGAAGRSAWRRPRGPATMGGSRGLTGAAGDRSRGCSG